MQQDKNLFIALGFLTVGGLLLFGIGNIFLAGIFFVAITLPGVAIMAGYYKGGRNTAPLAVPGLIITGTGVMLMFQALTGYWSSWAYAWTLYGVFIGGGILLMAQRLEEPNLAQIGRWMVAISGSLFVLLGGLFIIATTPIISTLFKLMLLGGGLFFLVKYLKGRGNTLPKVKRSAPDVEENIEGIRVRVA